MSGLTPEEREALRTSGSWPNVGRDIFAAVERIVAAREATAAEQARAEAELTGYFIAPDANDEPTLWRENGDRPIYVIGVEFFRDDPAVWDLLVTATAPRTPLQRANAAADELERAVGEMGES